MKAETCSSRLVAATLPMSVCGFSAPYLGAPRGLSGLPDVLM